MTSYNLISQTSQHSITALVACHQNICDLLQSRRMVGRPKQRFELINQLSIIINEIIGIQNQVVLESHLIESGIGDEDNTVYQAIVK